MDTAHAAGDRAPATAIAPSLGVVLAGVALAACFFPWTSADPFVAVETVDGSVVGAALALLTALAFAARRHVGLDRRVGAGVAGVAALGVVGVALARLLLPATGGGTAPTVEPALPVAALTALVTVGLAAADFRGMADDELVSKGRGTAFAAGIGVLGFLVSSLIAVVPGLLARSFGTTVSIAVLTVGSGVGLAVFAAGYLRVRDLGWDYVDLAWPDLQAVAYSIGGLVVLFLSAGMVSFAFSSLGLPTAESGIEELAGRIDNPEFLLVLVPLSFLAIGPGEELVYRNVVQKYLYERFSRSAAIVVASVVFGAVHFQQYADPNPVATVSTLFLVFVLSLVLGYSYYKTENLLVPIFIHGAFNAIQFAALYAQLTMDLPAS